MTQDNMTPAQQDHAAVRLRERIKYALQAAGDRANDAYAVRAAAIAEIGALLRLDDEQPDGVRIGITGAQAYAGLSRPTLTAARDDLTAWNDLAQLASRALDDDEDARAKLEARLPALGGWRAAAECLLHDHDHDYDPFADFGPDRAEGPGTPEGYTVLMDRYRKTLRRLAAGEALPDEPL
jgi:hypothetical protein